MPAKLPIEVFSFSVQLTKQQMEALEKIRLETQRGGRSELVRMAVDDFINRYEARGKDVALLHRNLEEAALSLSRSDGVAE